MTEPHCPVYLHSLELPLAVTGDLATVERYVDPLDRKATLPVLLEPMRVRCLRVRIPIDARLSCNARRAVG